jgi:hypothetical protein
MVLVVLGAAVPLGILVALLLLLLRRRRREDDTPDRQPGEPLARAN